ncbi:MAG TPA: FtsX-like permease family protein [Sedimentisphaerales bacterium]|nr:FtsX-like permease family protein [Sedimentisphaerales bacterium]
MYKVILSFRYLFKRRISYLAFLSVALCVFIVVVVMTVMRGLVTDFRQKNHSFVGDCVVGTESLVGFAYYEDFMRLLDAEGFVEGVSPVIKSYALVTFGDSERSAGVEIMGIEPAKHNRATGFGSTLYYHKGNPAKAFEPGRDANLPGFVAGIDVWLQRDADGRYTHEAAPAQTARTVSCFPLTAKGALAKAGAGVVNTKTFYYSDTSQSGLARVDSSTLYLPFDQAQLLCGMAGPDKRASWLCVKFKPNIKLEAGCEKVASLWRKFAEERRGRELSNLLETVTVQSWKDNRREFIAAMEKEQTMMIVLFALVGVTTVFIIFVVFYMIVSHKSKDIGILKSVGVSNAGVIGLYLGFSFLVGILGSFVGVLGGWVFLLKINGIEDWLFEHFEFQLWDRTIYAIGDIPNQMDLGVLGIIVVSAVIACLAGAFVPSRQAARLRPVEALQVSQL